jgi:hypothetical protein
MQEDTIEELRQKAPNAGSHRLYNAMGCLVFAQTPVGLVRSGERGPIFGCM